MARWTNAIPQIYDVTAYGASIKITNLDTGWEPSLLRETNYILYQYNGTDTSSPPVKLWTIHVTYQGNGEEGFYANLGYIGSDYIGLSPETTYLVLGDGESPYDQCIGITLHYEDHSTETVYISDTYLGREGYTKFTTPPAGLSGYVDFSTFQTRGIGYAKDEVNIEYVYDDDRFNGCIYHTYFRRYGDTEWISADLLPEGRVYGISPTTYTFSTGGFGEYEILTTLYDPNDLVLYGRCGHSISLVQLVVPESYCSWFTGVDDGTGVIVKRKGDNFDLTVSEWSTFETVASRVYDYLAKYACISSEYIFTNPSVGDTFTGDIYNHTVVSFQTAFDDLLDFTAKMRDTGNLPPFVLTGDEITGRDISTLQVGNINELLYFVMGITSVYPPIQFNGG